MRSFDDFESIVVTGTTAIGLTETKIAGRQAAIVTVETEAIRCRLDGVDPTAVEGHLLQPGDVLELTSSRDLLHVRFISTGVDAKLHVSYARQSTG